MSNSMPPNWHLKKLQNEAIRFNQQASWFVSNVITQKTLTLSELESHGEHIERFCDIIINTVGDIKESILIHYCKDSNPHHPLLDELEYLIEQKKELAETLIRNLEKDADLTQLVANTIKKSP